MNFADTTQGATVFRNRFLDENDIVATFTTTIKRVKAHQSGDNLTFRILGLDNIWAIGAGRTGQYAGQTNLFPFDSVSTKGNHKGTTGRLLDYKFTKDGSGYARGAGSCMGVEDHVRLFQVDYSKKTGATAVFVIDDKSTNGKTWRLNTPEFNTVIKTRDGFLITAPNGSSLKATVFNGNSLVDVRTSKIHYGGDTKDHNTGIAFKGEIYSNSIAIDCKCNGNIMVVMTLLSKGEEHPDVKMDTENRLVVGNITHENVLYKPNSNR